MTSLFERNYFPEEVEAPEIEMESKFDEILKDEQDILSIPLERLNEYFSDFGVRVRKLEEEEHHPGDSNDIQSWSILAEIAPGYDNKMDLILEDLDLSEYVDSACFDSGRLNITFPVEIELD